MCCIFTALVLLGPRIGGALWWLFQPNRWYGSIGAAFDSWFWPVLGLIFLPWTTIMYVSVYTAGITWWEWGFLILAAVIDIGSYGGGAYGNRSKLGMS